MADSFGLGKAVAVAEQGKVSFSKKVLLTALIIEAEKAHDMEEGLKLEYRAIERKVSRGEWPKMDKFEKLSSDCDGLAKKMRANYKVVLKAVKDDVKTIRAGNDKNKLKFITEIEDKLDDIGAFLHRQERRPSAGELTLDLLNRRGRESEDKGPKRSSSVDSKKPGGHLLDEVEFFRKKHKNGDLDDLAKQKKSFDALDKVVETAGKLKMEIKSYIDFMGKPDIKDAEKVRPMVMKIDSFERDLLTAKRGVESLEKVFKRLGSSMKDNKEVVSSLQGSFNKTKERIEQVEEKNTSSVGASGKSAIDKFDAECATLRKKP